MVHGSPRIFLHSRGDSPLPRASHRPHRHIIRECRQRSRGTRDPHTARFTAEQLGAGPQDTPSGPAKAGKEAAAKCRLNVFQQCAQAQSMSEQQGRALHHAKRPAHRRFQGGSLPRRDPTLSRKMVIRGLAPYRPATPGPRHRSQSGLRSQNWPEPKSRLQAKGAWSAGYGKGCRPSSSSSPSLSV